MRLVFYVATAKLLDGLSFCHSWAYQRGSELWQRSYLSILVISTTLIIIDMTDISHQ